MARFVDLDDDDGEPAPMPGQLPPSTLQQEQHLLLLKKLQHLNSRRWPQGLYERSQSESDEMDGSTFRSSATDAMQCYPIVIAIATEIDLNTLDALSRTCRRIHHGLLSYRNILLSSTLRCCNEAVPVDPSETFRYRARAGNWFYMEDGRSYNGKSGDCARDMVGGCRRCGEVICRNCAIKPPAPVALRERHRRLCKTCTHAPIATLAKPPLDPDFLLLSDAVQRAVCKCEGEGVWLCQPCGRSIRGADHEYQRIWRWRNQYGEILGGLGTGIGEGDRGVICGREASCLAAKEREQQLDCDAEDARDGNHHATTPDVALAPVDQLIDELRLTHERTPSPSLGPGYNRHEIEGIGGIVKRKRVRMVKVGACVPEWDDERGIGRQIMGREVRGARRSWCGWCWRVVPGEKDLDSVCGGSSSSGDSRRTSTSTLRSSV
ncbi:Fc.00g098050.m01.CDS01 [Cosmosporella sp. VM-42]